MNRNRGERQQIRQWTGTEPRREMRGAHRDTSALLTEIFFGALWALWGYLLGRCALPFAVYPLGMGLLCAATRRVPYLFAGLCLSSLGMSHPAMRVLSYAVALLIRLLSRFTVDTPWSREEGRAAGERTLSEMWPHLFSEHVGLRMATSCVGSFTVGLYVLIRGGFLYYDLYGALLGVAVCPLATLLFSGLFREEDRKAGRISVRLIGFLAVSAAVVYAARSVTLLGISAAACGTVILTLYMTRRHGTVRGILTGVLCGLAYKPVLAPIFVFSALCGGLLFPVSVTLCAAVSFVAGSAWALYVSGLSALTGLWPGLLSGNLLYTVVDKLFLAEQAAKAEEALETHAVCRALPASEADGLCLDRMASRVKTLCEGFSELSEVFSAMGRTMQRPGSEELRRICDNAFDSSCAGCAGREECWETRYRDTDGEIGRLCAALHTHGKLEFCHAGEELRGRCSRLPDILDEINCNAALYATRMLQCDRTEIFASDYAFMADVLSETVAREPSAAQVDTALSEALAEALEAEALGVAGVLLLSGERPCAVIRTADPLSESRAARIEEQLLRVGGYRMAAGPCERREAGDYETLFGLRESLTFSFARRTVRAEGEEEYCGDTVGVFGNTERRYAFISDGMGAGREAAMTSGICALFLQKLLGAGNRCETALAMLNAFLRNKGSGSLHECSATVDLLELDPATGRASFYKSGAAPTYVLRDGSLFKLRSKTLPVGILRETDVKRISFELTAGDVIVMVSDGVTQGREECPWLFDLLRSNVETEGIEACAERIVRYAKSEGATDDLSVLILRVEEAGVRKTSEQGDPICASC